jgi:putative oxidoreductase
MQLYLGKFDGYLYAAMRIVLAFLYWSHGPAWLFGSFGGFGPVDPTSIQGVAGILETSLGILILIGLFTPWAAFIASGEMAVAYFYFHLQRGQGWMPIMNGSEITVALCFGFLYIAARGSGMFSVDSWLASRKANK